MTGPNERPWSVDDEDALVDILGRCVRADGSGLLDLIDGANNRLSLTSVRLFMPRSPDLRGDLQRLVDSIRARSDAEHYLRALKDAAVILWPDLDQVEQLEQLVGRMAPDDCLTRTELRHLLANLDRLNTRVLAAQIELAVEAARCPVERPWLDRSETLPKTVRRLNQYPVPSSPRHKPACQVCSGGTLLLRFLAELAGRFEDKSDRQLMRYTLGGLVTSSYPRDWGPVLDSLKQRFRDAGRAPAAGPPRRVLQISLPESTAPSSKTVAYAPQAVLYDWHEQLGLCNAVIRTPAQAEYTRAELKEHGDTMFGAWADLASELATHSESRIEFLLPWSLLDFPVENWLMVKATDYPVPLGREYPVVLRSLDRFDYLTSGFRADEWHRRWQSVQHEDAHQEHGADHGAGHPAGPPGPVGSSGHRSAGAQQPEGIWGRLGWMTPRTDPAAAGNPPAGPVVLWVAGEESEVRAWLEDNGHHAGLVLGYSYRYTGQNIPFGGPQWNVRSAVYEGLPMLLWCRDGADAAILAKLLARNPKLRFKDIPAELRRWRRLASADRPEDERHRIALLWDDPECVPEGSRFKAPAPRVPMTTGKESGHERSRHWD